MIDKSGDKPAMFSPIKLGMELTSQSMAGYRAKFYDNDKTRLAQNVVSKSDVFEACVQRNVVANTVHVFNNKVEEVKPMTNQKSSGRCWVFACLNAMRIPFMKEKEIEDFEFSQAYLFFCDKVERCNYFLTTVAELCNRVPKEDVDGRLMSFLLHDPVNDGGQWDMVVNLIQKHGVMPKKCFPESFSCESSRRLNAILKSKMREYAHDIIEMVQGGASHEQVAAAIKEKMVVIYRIAGICLGVPPETFTWEYYDKSKNYKKIGPLSPLEFYEKHVRPLFDVTSKVCLVSDPRPQNPAGQTYTVDCLGNVVGGQKTIYNNQTIETLMDIASKAIKAGEPVWFGCDVSKYFASKPGILDLDVLGFELVFDTSVNLGLTKADRLIYGDSEMNHAMVLTACQIEDDGRVTKWRVENSWGDDRHDKGFITMTSDWFKEFVFEIVVDKSHCSKEVLDVFDKDPIVLPAWDPMGSLARTSSS